MKNRSLAVCICLVVLSTLSSISLLAQETYTIMRYTKDCLGRLSDGRLIVQRYDKLYLVDEASPNDDAPALTMAQTTPLQYRTINVQSMESDIDGDKICLSEVDLDNYKSSLTFGDTSAMRRIAGSVFDVILDAQIDPKGKFVTVLRSRKTDAMWFLELQKIDMDSAVTTLFSFQSPDGEISCGSLGDSVIAFSTFSFTRTMSMSGRVLDSIDRYHSILHVTNSGGVLGINGKTFTRFNMQWDVLGEDELPDTRIDLYRISGDEIAIMSSRHYALLSSDGIIFLDTMYAATGIHAITPNGKGLMYLLTWNGDLLTVHPASAPEHRFQLVSRPGQPLFSTGLYKGKSTTYMASYESAIVARFDPNINKWIVPQGLLHQLFNKNIELDCSGEYVSVSRNNSSLPTEITTYNTATDEVTRTTLPELYSSVRYFHNRQILLLKRVTDELVNHYTARPGGEILDSIAIYFYRKRSVGDTAVIVNDSWSDIIQISVDGKMTRCHGSNMHGNQLTPVAEKRGKFYGTWSNVLSTFDIGCDGAQTQEIPVPNVTTVVAVGDSLLYVQDSRQIVTTEGRVLLHAAERISGLASDSNRVYMYSRLGPHVIVQTLGLGGVTSVPTERNASTSQPILFFWDGSRITSSGTVAFDASQYHIYSAIGQGLGTWSVDNGTSLQLPTGVYFAVPIGDVSAEDDRR